MLKNGVSRIRRRRLRPGFGGKRWVSAASWVANPAPILWPQRTREGASGVGLNRERVQSFSLIQFKAAIASFVMPFSEGLPFEVQYPR